MVSILEKLLRDIGPDELEVLIEQYRQFGLKAEDETAVYNIVGMLKDFNMSADEVMVRLYRLGQVMGIKDAQADLEYAKLQAKAKSARGVEVYKERAGSSKRFLQEGAGKRSA
jgi:dihydrodipicolinate synthase/N-acetylneuraminate lyase